MTDIELEAALTQIRQNSAEADKLHAEQLKLQIELLKLQAGGMKFSWKRTALEMTSGAALLGAGAVFGQVMLRLAAAH